MSASVTQHLHSPVVSHSSLSHPQSATPKEVASSIVSERCMKLYKEEMAQSQMVKIIWFPKVIPKHVFIGWLIVHNRLSTKDRML